MEYKASIRSTEAVKIAGWIRERGGLAVWPSIDLSDPGKQLLTPAREKDGQPTFKPHWSVASEPKVIITDPAEVEVCEDVEVKRFRVGVRMGSQGMKMKVTDGGSRRIRAAVAKAGDGAYHVFDYETQEAVIMAPRRTWPLSEHERNKEAK